MTRILAFVVLATPAAAADWKTHKGDACQIDFPIKEEEKPKTQSPEKRDESVAYVSKNGVTYAYSESASGKDAASELFKRVTNRLKKRFAGDVISATEITVAGAKGSDVVITGKAKDVAITLRVRMLITNEKLAMAQLVRIGDAKVAAKDEARFFASFKPVK